MTEGQEQDSPMETPNKKPDSSIHQFVSWIIRNKNLLLLLAIYSIALLVVQRLSGQEAVREWIAQLGVLGILAIFVLLIVTVVAPVVSSDVVAIVAGSLFGFATGFFLTWLAQFIGTMIGYYLVRRSVESLSPSQNLSQKIKRSRWFGLLNRLPVSSPIFLIAGRWIPGYGGEIVYVLAGLYRVSPVRMMLCTAISVLVPAVQYPAIGAGLLGVFAN